MIDHNSLTNLLKADILEIQDYRKKLSARKADMPKGTLHILECGSRKPQYYQYLGKGKRTYISAKDTEKIKRLAQKSYDQDMRKILEEREQTLRKCLAGLGSRIEDYYEKMPESRRKLVSPIIPSENQYIDEWYLAHPGQQNPFPISNPIITDREETVRSKSEKILADMFNRYQVPYVYEPRIVFANSKVIYPDFITLNCRLRKTIVWEHFGMMGDNVYVGKNLARINMYETNGYWPGDNLIFSIESDEQPLNVKLAEKMIRKYLV